MNRIYTLPGGAIFEAVEEFESKANGLKGLVQKVGDSYNVRYLDTDADQFLPTVDRGLSIEEARRHASEFAHGRGPAL